MPSRRRIVTTTLGIWSAAVMLFEAWRIWHVLSGRPVPDEYANHLGFQLLASVFLVVTRWLPVLLVVFGLEAAAALIARHARRRANGE